MRLTDHTFHHFLVSEENQNQRFAICLGEKVNSDLLLVVDLNSAGAGNFSLHHCVQNSYGAHPASYPMGTRGSYPGVKAAVA
jgi:hypothetical protein